MDMSGVLSLFGLSTQSVVKEKSYYICDTDNGKKLVRIIDMDDRDILFCHQVKEGLAANGFTSLDRFRLSVDGRPFVNLLGSSYVVTDYFPGVETDFSDNGEFLRILDTVAQMHLFSPKVETTSNPQNLQELAKKGQAELSRYKKRILKQNQISDFDIRFLREYDYYMKSLDNFLSYVRDTGALEAMAAGPQLCHSALKEENILKSKSDGGIVITNFFHCQTCSRIYDLAGLIRRYLKHSPRDTRLPLDKIIESYEKISPLSDGEKKGLWAVLMFPEKYLRLCNQYYNKKRSWVPVSFLNMAKELCAQKQDFDEYIGLNKM